MNHAKRSASPLDKISLIHELEFEDRIDRMTQARLCSIPTLPNTIWELTPLDVQDVKPRESEAKPLCSQGARCAPPSADATQSGSPQDPATSDKPLATSAWVRAPCTAGFEGSASAKVTQPFTDHGHPALTELEARITQLERDLDIACQERDILKRAVVLFAKEQGNG